MAMTRVSSSQQQMQLPIKDTSEDGLSVVSGTTHPMNEAFSVSESHHQQHAHGKSS